MDLCNIESVTQTEKFRQEGEHFQLVLTIKCLVLKGKLQPLHEIQDFPCLYSSTLALRQTYVVSWVTNKRIVQWVSGFYRPKKLVANPKDLPFHQIWSLTASARAGIC